ncbi:hypothetical protein CC79DRAFT_1400504 [Sarocladium strictum]
MPQPTFTRLDWQTRSLPSDPQHCDMSSDDGSQHLDQHDGSSDDEYPYLDPYDDSHDDEIESPDEPADVSEEASQSVDKDDEMSDVDSDDLSNYSSEDPRDYLDEDGFVRDDIRDDESQASDDSLPIHRPELILSDEGASEDQEWYPSPPPEEQEQNHPLGDPLLRGRGPCNRENGCVPHNHWADVNYEPNCLDLIHQWSIVRRLGIGRPRGDGHQYIQCRIGETHAVMVTQRMVLVVRVPGEFDRLSCTPMWRLDDALEGLRELYITAVISSSTAYPERRPAGQDDASPKSCREAGECIAESHAAELSNWDAECNDIITAIEKHYEEVDKNLECHVALPAGQFIPFAMNCKMVLIIDDRKVKFRPVKETLTLTKEELEKWRGDGAAHMHSYEVGQLLYWLDGLVDKGPADIMTVDRNVQFKFVCLDGLPLTVEELNNVPEMPTTVGLAEGEARKLLSSGERRLRLEQSQ